MTGKSTLTTLKKNRRPVMPAGSRPYAQIAQAVGQDTLVLGHFLPRMTARNGTKTGEATLKKQIVIVDNFFAGKKLSVEKREKPFHGHVVIYGIRAEKIFYVAPGLRGGEVITAVEISAKHFARLGTEVWEIVLSLIEHIARSNKRAMVLDIPNSDRGPLFDPDENLWYFVPTKKH